MQLPRGVLEVEDRHGVDECGERGELPRRVCIVQQYRGRLTDERRQNMSW